MLKFIVLQTTQKSINILVIYRLLNTKMNIIYTYMRHTRWKISTCLHTTCSDCFVASFSALKMRTKSDHFNTINSAINLVKNLKIEVSVVRVAPPSKHTHTHIQIENCRRWISSKMMLKSLLYYLYNCFTCVKFFYRCCNNNTLLKKNLNRQLIFSFLGETQKHKKPKY